MFDTTAFFHQSPSDRQKFNPKSAKNKVQHRLYSRFNSLEGECHTEPKAKMADQNLDAKIQPTNKEQKWFQGHYNSYPIQYHSHQQSYYSPPYWLQQQPPFQVPYNLNKGQFEIWPMEAVHHQQNTFVDPHVAYVTQESSMHYQSNNGTFTKCVSSLLDWGSAALATATALTSSLLSSPTTSNDSWRTHDSCESPASSTSSTSKQSLNPNAKEFVPLNPNAKEFTPANSSKKFSKQELSPKNSLRKSSNQMPVPDRKSKSPETVSLRTVAQRKCTPWIPPGSSFGSFDDFELPRGELSDSDSESDDSDQDHEQVQRARLLSQCSEDGFITFEDSSPKVKCAIEKIDTQQCSQFMKDFLAGKNESETEESDYDSDWDEVDKSDAFDENLLEECGLKCQWIVQPVEKSAKPKLEKFQDTFPTDFDHDQVLLKIRMANQEWDKIPSQAVNKELETKVKFDLDNLTRIFEEDPALAEDLRSARMGVNYAQKRADRDRYDRILGPIFNEEHRDKMRSYINQRYLT